MLSVENPPPQDPPPPSLPSQSPCPCPCDEKSGGNLNSRSRCSDDDDDDERVSSGKKVETETVAVDLLPTFSIRDYVFSNRSKDIKKNWPFSQEKLQICLNHGMKEVLPPFQTSDALRQCKKNIRKDSDGKKKLYGSSDDDDEKKKLVVSGFQEAQDFPASSSATQSCSGDADSDSASVPNNNNSNNILEKEEHFLAKSCKSGNNNNNNNKPEAVTAVKKCKFMVKLSHLGHTTAGGGGGAREDGVGATMNNNNNYIVSEAMAFKVCPVCKTFSSSSNTTLNAHIDQCLCLSGDSSATKWHHGDNNNNNNKLLINKNRIKPRKMRSMADIYETALHCTLEELDRRNGTNWASNSCTPPPAAQEKQIPVHLPDDDDDNDDEESPNQNAVYIDANGTKVRILSKFSDPSSDSKSSDDHHHRSKKKLIKGGKFVLAKKKKKFTDHLQKQQKVPKLDDAPPPTPVKKICTFDSVVHTSQIDRDQATDFPCEKNDEKVNYITRELKASDQGKFSKPEMIKGWACSKRTGLTKKANGRDGHHHHHQHSGGNTANKEMPSENIQSSRSISLKKSSIVKNRYEDLPSSSNSKRTTDTSSHETHSEYEDHHHHPSPKKRGESQGLRSRKRSLMVEEFPDRSPKNLKHDGNRRREVKAGNLRNFEHSEISQKMSSSPKRILSRSKLSVLKKRALTGDGQVSASDSKFYSKKKSLAVKKSRMQYISQTHRKEVASQTRVDRHFMPSPSENQSSEEEETSSEESIERTRKVEMRDEATHHHHHHHHDVGENCGSLGQSGAFNCTSASDDNRGESAGKSESAGCRRDINIELPSEEETVRGMFAGLNETMDSRFDGEDDDDDDSRGMQHDSRQYIEEYREPMFESEGPTSSAEPILSGDEQEMFCENVDTAEKNMMGKNDCQVVELNSSNGKGNYFDEVDSIPIPGPPGSFLPSPGRMDSEDIPGISSLSSSSRIQTSDDHSSESPISTTSTISNSTLGRKYEAKSSPPQNVSRGSSPLVDQLRSDHISGIASTNVVDDFAPVRNASDDAAGGGGLDEVKFANEKGTSSSSSFRYKNDQQPCCCSRKEMLLTQNVVGLNYQDSALLRRRTMAAVGKSEMNDDDRNVNRSLDNVRTVNERSLVPEEGVLSMGTAVQISSRVSSVPVHGNYESSPSPATPNPVLRLMGKNLMVVNKEENLTPPPQSRTPDQSSNSIANVHENSKTVPVPLVSQGPFFFDRREEEEERKGFIHQHHHHHPDMRWSTSFGSQVRQDHHHHHHQVASSVESPPGRMVVSRGAVMQQEFSAGTGAGGSSRYHHNNQTPIQVFEPMMNLQQQQYRGTKMPLNYEMETKTGGENSSQQHLHCWKKKKSWDHPLPPPDKELIIIDDTPITATAAAAAGRHKQQQQQHWREGGDSGSGFGLGCDSWSLNPFYVNEAAAATTTRTMAAVGYEYRPIGGAYNTGSGISVNNPSIRVAGGNGNINGMRWNCNPEGVVYYQSSAVAASSSPAPAPAPAGAPAGLFKSSGLL